MLRKHQHAQEELLLKLVKDKSGMEWSDEKQKSTKKEIDEMNKEFLSKIDFDQISTTDLNEQFKTHMDQITGVYKKDLEDIMRVSAVCLSLFLIY